MVKREQFCQELAGINHNEIKKKTVKIPVRKTLSVEEIVKGILQTNTTILARAITLIESNKSEHQKIAQEVLLKLYANTGKSIRIGISGIPGAGKSTFIEAFGSYLTEQGHKVAVLAIDPTSRVTGGSILGDKTRMQSLAGNENAFIRPSPSGTTLGGVARKTRETMFICEAAGFDVTLVETVGVGQNETTVADMVDFFLVLMVAGTGDELQGIKRGILEIADMLAINKADGENKFKAQKAAIEYKHALHYMRPSSQNWNTPVETCSAITKEGISDIWNTILKHKTIMTNSGELQQKRSNQLLTWMWSMVEDSLMYSIKENSKIKSEINALQSAVLAGSTTPTLASLRVLELFYNTLK